MRSSRHLCQWVAGPWPQGTLHPMLFSKEGGWAIFRMAKTCREWILVFCKARWCKKGLSEHGYGFRGRHGGGKKRGEEKPHQGHPSQKGVLDPPSYGTFSTPFRCHCSVFPLQKSKREQNRSNFGGLQTCFGRVRSLVRFPPPYVLHPPISRPNGWYVVHAWCTLRDTSEAYWPPNSFMCSFVYQLYFLWIQALLRRLRMSGRRMSETSRRFPKHFVNCDSPEETKERRQELRRCWPPRSPEIPQKIKVAQKWLRFDYKKLLLGLLLGLLWGRPRKSNLVTFELLLIFQGFGASRRSAASQGRAWTAKEQATRQLL